MPYLAKDIVDTVGRAPRLGYERSLSDPPKNDAEILARLDGAGAKRSGFARMTKLAYEPSGIGTAINPWNAEVAPGGSSSGSAVAVACGAVPLALGSDTAGSLRIPAAACGITSLKPTPGLFPMAGVAPLAPDLDTIGFMATSARDVALAMSATATTPYETGSAASRHAFAVAGDVLETVSHEASAAVEQAAGALETAGYPRGADVDVLPRIAAVDAATLRVLQGQAARTFAAITALPETDAVLEQRLAGGRAIDIAVLEADLAARTDAQAAFVAEVFGEADYLVLPTLPFAPPTRAVVDPASPDFSARTLYGLSAYTRFANYLGLPVLVLPCGFDDACLPIGLQMIGRAGADANLLAAGEALQAVTDWHARIPPTAKAILDDAEKTPA